MSEEPLPRKEEEEAPDPERGEGEPGEEVPGDFDVDLEALTEEDVRELLEKAREGADLLERLKRLQAEHENYRKRMAREAATQRVWALRDFARDILPVVDDLERAVESSKEGPLEGGQSILEGVKMVLESLRNVLKRNGIEPIEAEGHPFDPAFHEAAGQVPAPGVPAGRVVTELVRGYLLKDVVVRPSRVLVAAAVPEPGEEGKEEGNP
ncbi:MAG: nucleotide exchange factor GrpE [Planctomycetota bacterium]|jgi:molecular chaperone GrpE